MKKILIFLFLVTLCFSSAARARDYHIGVGVMGGDPIGANAKFWFTKAIAADAAVGYSFLGNNGVQVHGDVLYHLFQIFDVSKGSMPIYLGLGARVKFENPSNKFGIRFPIGIEYIFDETPIDVFGEVVPVLDVSPNADAAFNGVVGVRYLF